MRRLLLAAMLLASLRVSATNFRTVPLYGDGTFDSLSRTVAVRELRDGGPPEIAVCQEDLVLTYSKIGGTFTRTWVAPASCASLAVADLDGDGRSEIVAGGIRGVISILDPASSARKTITLPGAVAINAVAAGNVDSDPEPEIVAATDTNTYVYDGVSLALEWTATGRSGTAVAIAEIDGDGKNEIILNRNGEGTVLDGYTQTYKWGYAGGFGYPFTAADVDGDGKAELIGSFSSNGAQIRILDGDTFTTSSFSGMASSGIAVGDANNDGKDEILGFSPFNTIYGYDPATGAQLWSVPASYYYLTAAAVADVDGNGSKELVSVGNPVRIIDVATKTTTSIAGNGISPYCVAAGDLDGDGHPEVIDAMATDSFAASAAIAEVRDGATGAVRGTLPLPSGFTIRNIVIGQFDQDPSLEVAVLGHKYYNEVYMYVFDGTTRALEYTTPAPSYGTPAMTDQVAVVGNLDADAIDEIIVPRSDNRFIVLNGATGVVQYVSDTLAGYIYDFALADTDGDGVKDLVIATDSRVYVYKTSDWSLRKSITVSNAAVHAVAATNGEVLYVNGTDYYGTDILVALAGDTLTEKWRCTAFPTYTLAMRYATIDGIERLVAVGRDGTLRIFASGGSACPTPDVARIGSSAASQLAIADVTGDGRPDLVAAFLRSFEADLIGDPAQTRGDVNGDGQVTDADIDALALYLYNGGIGAPATADANGDGCILGDDLFYLVNYRKGTGAAPPP